MRDETRKSQGRFSSRGKKRMINKVIQMKEKKAQRRKKLFLVT
jgi:hypothetical protein